MVADGIKDGEDKVDGLGDGFDGRPTLGDGEDDCLGEEDEGLGESVGGGPTLHSAFGSATLLLFSSSINYP